MARTTPLAADLRDLAGDFRRHLNATNRSPRTVETYLKALDHFLAWLESESLPTLVSEIRRAHIESWVVDILAKNKASTASVRFRALRVFWNWAVDEEEVEKSPMARMKQPIVPLDPPPILSDDDLARLLATCRAATPARAFEARRDLAILRVLIDTGIRRGELAALTVDDVNLHSRVAIVMGKGRRRRVVAFGHKTAQAIGKYLRLRARYPGADRPELWLGEQGPMKPNGIGQMVERRARQAGLTGVHLHVFRHIFVHRWLAAGGGETDLMMLAGWGAGSRSMLSRYGASAAAERAGGPPAPGAEGPPVGQSDPGRNRRGCDPATRAHQQETNAIPTEPRRSLAEDRRVSRAGSLAPSIGMGCVRVRVTIPTERPRTPASSFSRPLEVSFWGRVYHPLDGSDAARRCHSPRRFTCTRSETSPVSAACR